LRSDERRRKTGTKFSLSGLAMAFGDFGTIIPLIVAIAFVSSMTVTFLIGIAAAFLIHKSGCAIMKGYGK
jgi:MFS-type transporter involved in bile tolerance (Atg22 family)